ncbi:asparaginase [Kocuria sp. CPCC 205258]|jgi:L-asparaginase II|uniref:asparaginase n=1 Tax=Kocuria TaxID=57493 RepID=UPI000365DAE4|nr:MULTISPECIES: asparaginase [Kocuria]EYT53380.1 asparaginase [Kocuria sp. UCD-OTCP]MEB2527021.1 asparaginase [Kocuria rosea]MEB2616820.1 asparaginase [Kocuria rosea]NVC23118.1 asparaginase [Kocuria salina]PWF82968.1 asparaginase [Kocuria rosea]
MQTFTSDRAVDLAVLERSGFVESRHRGSAVVLDPDGAVAVELGDIGTPIFPRSTLKPFQTIAAMKAGVPLRGAQVAIASASHIGSFEQLDAVSSILTAAGLTEDALQCPPDWPEDEEVRTELVRAGRGKSRICMNCSGKHAAFLWACTENDWPTDSYLDPEHPLQRTVLETVEEFSGERVAHVGVDGCGAPLAAISLTGLARAYSTLGRAAGNLDADARAATVSQCMLDYPELVHGRGRYNTVVMEELDVVAKLGAEGVLALGTRTGWSVALKVLDGGSRANALIGLALLAHAGAVPAAAAAAVIGQVVRPVMGGSRPVGRLRLADPLLELLGPELVRALGQD